VFSRSWAACSTGGRREYGLGVGGAVAMRGEVGFDREESA